MSQTPHKKPMKSSSVGKTANTSPIQSSKKTSDFRANAGGHKHFLAALLLFAGLSMYAIATFMTSNNQYINGLSANVASPEADVVTVYEDPVSVANRENPFKDLNSDHQNYEAVISLYYEGILSGYDDGTFQPDKKVNRAEFSKMIVEAVDLDYTSFPSAKLSNCFGDVKDLPVDWFAPAVCAAKYKGWVSGYDGGDFKAGKNIVKAEGLKIVLKAFGFKIPENSEVKAAPYEDVDMEKDWFVAVAEVAKENGIVKAEGNFSGGYELSRADLAQVIYNAMMTKGAIK